MKVVFKFFFILISIATTSLNLNLSYAQTIHADTKIKRNLPKPQIAIVATGGTISETKNEENKLLPSLSGKKITALVPGLNKLAKINVINFSKIDSSQMSPNIWNNLAKLVVKLERTKKFHGIVIMHGTDTMTSGAYYLSLVLHHNYPVVFIGAMRSPSNPFFDGDFNLINGVKEALDPIAQHWGVTVNFNQNIYSPQCIYKANTINTQAFSSCPKGALGYIAENKIVVYQSPKLLPTFQIPKVLPRVALITTYAGSHGDFIRYATNHGYKGIVIEAFGAGNVNAASYQAIQYALKKGVIVVDTTLVPEGGTWPIYNDQGGAATLQQSGVVLAGNIHGDNARLLLMLALSNGNHTIKQIQKIFDQYQ